MPGIKVPDDYTEMRYEDGEMYGAGAAGEILAASSIGAVFVALGVGAANYYCWRSTFIRLPETVPDSQSIRQSNPGPVEEPPNLSLIGLQIESALQCAESLKAMGQSEQAEKVHNLQMTQSDSLRQGFKGKTISWM